MDDLLIWVNENDQVIGYGNKQKTHSEGILHRAFSIFIYDKDTDCLLLQRRALNKYHSGGLWSNSCCSHFYKDESEDSAIRRCINNELGFSPMFNTYLAIGSNDPSFNCSILENEYRPLLIGDLYYYSDYGTQKEHEVDSIILWSIHTQEIQSIVPNPNEIAELQWVSLNHISEMCDQHEEKFTSWFIPAYRKVGKELDSIASWKMRES